VDTDIVNKRVESNILDSHVPWLSGKATMPLDSVLVSLGQPDNVPIRMSEKGQQKGKENV